MTGRRHSCTRWRRPRAHEPVAGRRGRHAYAARPLRRPAPATRAPVSNHDYAGFAALLHDYLRELALRPEFSAACFAVAAPVCGTRVRLTNLDWELDCAALETQLGVRHMRLLNDFAALALALRGLEACSLHKL
ncbi:MAG: glucokinase, partial [Gammaproteobacteria bacterium]